MNSNFTKTEWLRQEVELAAAQYALIQAIKSTGYADIPDLLRAAKMLNTPCRNMKADVEETKA